MIVSDSTALITLINIDEFSIFTLFVEHIIVPKEVYEEVCVFGEAKIFLDRQIDRGFVVVESCENKVLFDTLCILLDKGESASIVLASQMNLPLLIDEKKGRKTADEMGIAIVGLIGVLRFLYIHEKISKDKTKSILQKLDASNFRVSKKLMDIVLA